MVALLFHFLVLFCCWSGASCFLVQDDTLIVPGAALEIKNGARDSWTMPFSKQTVIACAKVKKMSEIKECYNIIGLSQGNIVSRGVIEFCDDAPPARNIISLAGPHAGIAAVPICKDMDGYKQGCRFLPKLNNEVHKNSTYKERFSSLDNLLKEDDVLVPRETLWFSLFPDGSWDQILPAQEFYRKISEEESAFPAKPLKYGENWRLRDSKFSPGVYCKTDYPQSIIF